MPVSACWPASSRITIVPPLMALLVVELPLPLAAIATGVFMLTLPDEDNEVPASLLAPPATWLSLVVPKPVPLLLPLPPKPMPPPTET